MSQTFNVEYAAIGRIALSNFLGTFRFGEIETPLEGSLANLPRAVPHNAVEQQAPVMFTTRTLSV